MVNKLAGTIPENELWLHKADHIVRIKKSLEWIKSNPRQDNFEDIVTNIKDYSRETGKINA